MHADGNITTGPRSCVTGENAEYADLHLAEVITEHVFCAGLDTEASRRALNTLRLSYWLAWLDRAGMWMSTAERDAFSDALDLYADEGHGLPEQALLAARLAAEAAASDACGIAHGA